MSSLLLWCHVQVTGVPVVKSEADRTLVGVLSKKDLSKPGKFVRDVYSSPPIAARPENKVADAACLMLKHKVGSLRPKSSNLSANVLAGQFVHSVELAGQPAEGHHVMQTIPGLVCALQHARACMYEVLESCGCMLWLFSECCSCRLQLKKPDWCLRERPCDKHIMHICTIWSV